jgi:hypothetical protein
MIAAPLALVVCQSANSLHVYSLAVHCTKA